MFLKTEYWHGIWARWNLNPSEGWSDLLKSKPTPKWNMRFSHCSKPFATVVPGEESGGQCATFDASVAIPRSSRMRHVLDHIITPAPISLNCSAASYTSTLISGYRDRATARQSPPIPPPLVECKCKKANKLFFNTPDTNSKLARLRHEAWKASLFERGEEAYN